MKVSILGVGRPERILGYTVMTEKELQKLVFDVAEYLAKKGYEIVIAPDKGIPLEVAKAYKAFGGKKVYGMVPVNDKKYGTKHIEGNLKFIDERIEVNDWYDVNGEIAAAGEFAICIGLSAGIMTEIAILKYHYKFFNIKTKVIMFANTMTTRLPKEIEEDLKGNLIYVNSVTDMKKYL